MLSIFNIFCFNVVTIDKIFSQSYQLSLCLLDEALQSKEKKKERKMRYVKVGKWLSNQFHVYKLKY